MAIGTPFVCGEAGAASTDTLVIPITVDVPRTDPDSTGGATIILIFYQLSYLSAANITDISDDVGVQDDFSLCVFEDGLNHYGFLTEPAIGLVVNDLVGATNSITIGLDSVADYIQATAVAITGIGPGASDWPGLPFDPAMTWIAGVISQFAEAPVGAPTSTSQGLGWTQTGSPTVTFGNPTGATDEDWDWQTGDLAFYWIQQNSSTSDQGGWTWDGAISDFNQWDVDSGIGRFMSFAIGEAAVVPTLAGPSVAGVFGDGSFDAAGSALALIGGAGPVCDTPPPTGGNPVFNNHIRLSE